MRLDLFCADKSHMSRIYYLWKKTKQRILNLEKSIDDGMVYVFLIDGGVNGFIRVNGNLGITLDYLRINEMILSEGVINSMPDDVYKFFMNRVDVLIVKFGYTRAKVTCVDDMKEVLKNSGWKKDCDKYVFSKSGKTYSNELYIRKIKYIDNAEKIFGDLVL